MNKKKIETRKDLVMDILLDVGADVFGSFIFAIGLICFVGPANIAPGGVAAVALMIDYVVPFSVPVGLVTLLINVPLLILAWRHLGHSFAIGTLRTLVVNTIITDMIVTPFFPIYEGDRLMGSLYGGILIGVGLAFIFMRGSTTGGSDIVSFLLQKKMPGFSIGRAVMIIDGIIIAASMAVYHSIDSGLFGIICLYAQTIVMDMIIYGLDKGRMVMVISPNNQEIASVIMEKMERGVTFLEGKGAYTGEHKDVIICAVRRGQFSKLKSIIHHADPNAFVIVTDVSEILGEGFKEHIDD